MVSPSVGSFFATQEVVSSFVKGRESRIAEVIDEKREVMSVLDCEGVVARLEVSVALESKVCPNVMCKAYKPFNVIVYLENVVRGGRCM